MANYEVFVTYINELGMLRSGPCSPSSGLLHLRKAGRQLVRYSSFTVDILFIRAIEEKN